MANEMDVTYLMEKQMEKHMDHQSKPGFGRDFLRAALPF